MLSINGEPQSAFGGSLWFLSVCLWFFLRFRFGLRNCKIRRAMIQGDNLSAHLTQVQYRERGRRDHDALKQVKRLAQIVAQRQFDQIAVRKTNDQILRIVLLIELLSGPAS